MAVSSTPWALQLSWKSLSKEAWLSWVGPKKRIKKGVTLKWQWQAPLPTPLLLPYNPPPTHCRGCPWVISLFLAIYATQRSNIKTMLKPFETMLQQCWNDVLQIVPCIITLKELFCKGKGEKEWIRVYPCAFAFILVKGLNPVVISKGWVWSSGWT